MIRVGVIGYGYWGPIVARNFSGAEGCELAAVSDQNPKALDRAKKAFPGIEIAQSASEIITSTAIDAVAVITPVWTHFELAKAALEAGKHVFVEKPFTSTVSQAEELVELAARKRLQIMVDHTFLFTGAVRKIRQLIDEGVLGSLYYYDSTRVNLGLFQHDVNVIWDLAPHDLSIMSYLLDAKPLAIAATGQCHYNGLEEMAYITVYFEQKILAHINVNWLSPVKVRTTLIGGEKKMVVWNDLEADEKVKVYDKGVNVQNGQVYDLLVSYRSGDVWIPKVDQTEALKREVSYFAECVSNNQAPFNDGAAGLQVVRLLESAAQSLKERGRPVLL